MIEVPHVAVSCDMFYIHSVSSVSVSRPSSGYNIVCNSVHLLTSVQVCVGGFGGLINFRGFLKEKFCQLNFLKVIGKGKNVPYSNFKT